MAGNKRGHTNTDSQEGNTVAPQSSSKTLQLFAELNIEPFYSWLLTNFAAKYGNDFMIPENLGKTFLVEAYTMFGRFLEMLLKTPARQLVTSEKELFEDWLVSLKSFNFRDGEWKQALLTAIENTKTLMAKVDRSEDSLQQSNNVKADKRRKTTRKFSESVTELAEARAILEAPFRFL